jgi:hypothetical protein
MVMGEFPRRKDMSCVSEAKLKLGCNHRVHRWCSLDLL